MERLFISEHTGSVTNNRVREKQLYCCCFEIKCAMHILTSPLRPNINTSMLCRLSDEAVLSFPKEIFQSL